jgi:hypothetical protein
MIYELRTYWAAPGKLPNLLERFRSITLKIFERHHMQVVGFWTPAAGTPECGDLIYILGFSDESAKVAAWEAFRNDPEWIAGKAASEINGMLTEKVTSLMMLPTDFSLLK